MKTLEMRVGTFEAKNRFSELIDRASRGGEVTITRHDKPVAKLVPASDDVVESRRKAMAGLLAASKKYSLKGIKVRDLIAEGRP